VKPGPPRVGCSAAGDVALTRRARAARTLSAVVVRFSRARKRYERQGILVEEDALVAAELQCLADGEMRDRRRARERLRRAGDDADLIRRFAAEIKALFPGCPTERAEVIARRASARGSGRVGRTAAGRNLQAEAVELAVIASIRHEDTDYDGLLMAGVDRGEAREHVRDEVDRTLERWRGE
jgi:hypothetical protein